MAAKVENLYKNNGAFRELGDEELERMAGGTFGTTSLDSEFLHDIGYGIGPLSNWNLIFHWDSNSAKVDAAWANFGIRCITDPCGENEFYIDGKNVSPREAYLRAAEQAGRTDVFDKYSSRLY